MMWYPPKEFPLLGRTYPEDPNPLWDSSGIPVFEITDHQELKEGRCLPQEYFQFGGRGDHSHQRIPCFIEKF